MKAQGAGSPSPPPHRHLPNFAPHPSPKKGKYHWSNIYFLFFDIFFIHIRFHLGIPREKDKLAKVEIQKSSNPFKSCFSTCFLFIAGLPACVS